MSSKQLPIVALVGRPNVGKSTLFNRLIGKRQAVVADRAGTTRDRLQWPLSWQGREFVLMDMAGLEATLANGTEISQATQAQVDRALHEASVLVWVVESSTGVTPQEEQIAVLLRNLHKPVVVAVNKCDDPRHDLVQYEFSRFGFPTMVPLSAIHGRGREALLDEITQALPAETVALPVAVVETEEEDRELRVSIVGRPNVGKSTLLNSLVEDERAVVSAEAGTTRDSVDTVIPAQNLFGKIFTRWQTVRLVDTAGIRRRGKIGHEVEAWSVLRSLDAIDRAQVVLFLIDATEGLVHQDLQVAERLVEAGRPIVLMVNKWDAYLEKKKIFVGTPEDTQAQDLFLQGMRNQAPFLHWVQVLFLSASANINTQYIGRLVNNAYVAWSLKVPDGALEDLAEQMRKQPRLKNLQSITLEHNQPPVFHIHLEGKRLTHFSTNRMIENWLRDALEIGPTPIKIWIVPSVQKKPNTGRR